MLRTLRYCFAAVVVAAPACAQLTAAKDAPVAMGHHHLNVTDIEAHRVLWGPLLGGELVKLGPIEGFKFPNVLLFLREKEPTSGSVGTAVNHIGFLVKDIKASIAKLKAGGIEVITRQAAAGATEDIIFNERTGVHMAFIQAPDQLKVELIEDRSLSTPIANHHIHYYTADVQGLAGMVCEGLRRGARYARSLQDNGPAGCQPDLFQGRKARKADPRYGARPHRL